MKIHRSNVKKCFIAALALGSFVVCSTQAQAWWARGGGGHVYHSGYYGGYHGYRGYGYRPYGYGYNNYGLLFGPAVAGIAVGAALAYPVRCVWDSAHYTRVYVHGQWTKVYIPRHRVCSR